jgi:hypothetical protein
MDVVYILGYGRSGSTLLDVLLGNARDIVSVGELDLLARDWDARVCSCGAPYPECSFWRRVRSFTDAICGPRTNTDRERTLRRIERISSLPGLLLGALPRGWRSEYRTLVRAELEGIASASGKRTILDSSKSAREAAGRAIALQRVAGVSVKLIHLVRDGRAVLWSVQRGDNVRLGDGSVGQDAAFALPTIRALFGWVLANAIALLTQSVSPNGRVLRVHYEDLVRDPGSELARIGAFLGCDLSDVARRASAGDAFDPGHSTGGNRLRRAGAVRLREDREWESRLGKPERALYWALGWPLALTLRTRPPSPSTNRISS